jgi:hypothetical protein
MTTASHSDVPSPEVETLSRTEADRYHLPAMLNAQALWRLGLIGAVMISLVACFAWAGGEFSRGRLDQTRMIDTFTRVSAGITPKGSVFPALSKAMGPVRLTPRLRFSNLGA